MRLRIVIATLVALALGVGLVGTAAAAPQNQRHQEQTGPNTITPIKYLVVIFQENVSFDHYLVPTQARRTHRESRLSWLSQTRLRSMG